MASSDYFLKIDGVEGESAADKMAGAINLESWSFGVSQSGTFAVGGGGGAGKASFNDFHFVMHANKASPKLFLACATGEHLKSAKLICRKAGGEQQDFETITMSDVLVSSFQSGGANGGDVLPLDQISLNYSKIEFEYKPQKPDGTLDSPIKTGYDIKLNKKV